MGLGKTLELISLLLDAKEAGQPGPSLVVCPASLIFNWENEIRRFAPALTVLPILGNAEQREQAIAGIGRYDVAVTSYDLLKRDIALYGETEFRYLVLDEAQYIKNHATQNAKAVKALRSRQRFALTGTPIENRLSELWSVFDFLMPGFLYSYNRFRDSFELPIVKNADAEALDRLHRMTAPFILRRLKRDVLHDLPEKTETIRTSVMGEEQRALYLGNVLKARERLADLTSGNAESGRMVLLALLTRLRQLCCDPALCYEDYTAVPPSWKAVSSCCGRPPTAGTRCSSFPSSPRCSPFWRSGCGGRGSPSTPCRARPPRKNGPPWWRPSTGTPPRFFSSP